MFFSLANLLTLIITPSPDDHKKLVDVKETSRETTLCLAAAHALVKLDDGTIVGDPMEKTTLDAMAWSIGKGVYFLQPFHEACQCSSGDTIAPSENAGPHRIQVTIRRRFQFSSALKRMSTISMTSGKTLVAVKGAPETIKNMLGKVPEFYDETYKWYTRKGSRVLALGVKEMETMSSDKVC